MVGKLSIMGFRGPIFIDPIIAFNKGLLGGVMLVRAVTREHAPKMPARTSQLCKL
jgi:hypothetical protein